MRKALLSRLQFTLLAATLLLGGPVPQASAQNSQIDVLTPGGAWTFCNSSSFGTAQTVPFVLTAATTPTPARVGSPVQFRVRRMGTSPSWDLDLQLIQHSPSEDVLTGSQISLSTNPGLPVQGFQEVSLQFVPPREGTYEFTFSSSIFGDNIFTCTALVPVEQSSCFITRIDGFPPGGGRSTRNLLDFGEVPLGQSEAGLLRFSFSRPLQEGQAPLLAGELDPVFAFRPVQFSASREEATLDWIFTPDRTGPISNMLQALVRSEEDSPECWVDFELRGVGGAPQISITFENPVCGASPQVTVVVSNDGQTQLNNLGARQSTGFRLTPDPLGSFNATNFSLGPAGSTNPPSQRGFTLEYPSSGASAGATVTVRQGSDDIASEPVPPAPACVEVTDPAQLTLNFGDVVVNDRAPGRSITLLNRGGSAVTVTAALASSGSSQGFGLGAGGTATSQQLSLAAGGSASLPVGFLPTTVGSKSSTVTFSSPDVDQIDSVRLLGNAIAEPTVTLTYISQGLTVNPGGLIRLPAAQVGRSSSAPLEILNSGTVTAQSLQLAASGDFSVNSTIPSSFAPGQTSAPTIAFTPTQSGTRRGTLTLSGANLSDPVTFALEGEGVLGEVRLSFLGLNPTVAPAQTPVPTVGITVDGESPAETIEGDLILEFDPNTAQAPGPEFATQYSVVRFMTGGGAGGRTIGFRIDAGQNGAVFPSEESAGAAANVARYQSGSVAGAIQFRLANLRTSAGAAISQANAEETIVQVQRLAPDVQLTTERTGNGVNLIIDSVSTPREITGVCIALNPASNSDLSFQRPDPTFLNSDFEGWFGDPSNYTHGGAFSLTIPVNIDNLSAFGSAQVWLRNSVGWSPGSACN